MLLFDLPAKGRNRAYPHGKGRHSREGHREAQGNLLIDTPEEIRVPSVRVNRDTADLRRMSPRTGALSMSPSICR